MGVVKCRVTAPPPLLVVVVVVKEEKCVGNAEEAVDDALEADTLNMLYVRYAVVGSSSTVQSFILLLVLVLVSVMLIVMMLTVAIRRRSITGPIQECSHGQLTVKLDICSDSHIHGRREITKGIGRVGSTMLSMLMRIHRLCHSTPRAVVRQMNCYCLQCCWA